VRYKALSIALMFSAAAAWCAPAAHAASQTDCTMHFTLSGWSVVYQTAHGHGTVTCKNGQSMKVDIDAKGGGLSVGKYKLADGVGRFSDVTRISQVLGSYAMANAHAGVVGSVRAAAMTKGNVSLALAGHGEGWDIGAGLSDFRISRAK
jgi:hypothetical protein